MGPFLAMVLLWKTPEGTQEWKAFSSWKTLDPFISSLLSKGVDPATMMIAPDSLYWMYKSLHNGRSTVQIRDIATEGELEAYIKAEDERVRQRPVPHDPPPDEDTFIGWISPDGRCFPCAYGGHADCARKIAGEMVPNKDAQTFLENCGWFAIYRNPVAGKSLAIGSGIKGKNRRLSDMQREALQKKGILDKINNLSWYL